MDVNSNLAVTPQHSTENVLVNVSKDNNLIQFSQQPSTQLLASWNAHLFLLLRGHTLLALSLPHSQLLFALRLSLELLGPQPSSLFLHVLTQSLGSQWNPYIDDFPIHISGLDSLSKLPTPISNYLVNISTFTSKRKLQANVSKIRYLVSCPLSPTVLSYISFPTSVNGTPNICCSNQVTGHNPWFHPYFSTPKMNVSLNLIKLDPHFSIFTANIISGLDQQNSLWTSHFYPALSRIYSLPSARDIFWQSKLAYLFNVFFNLFYTSQNY